jgi:Methionine synthase II (cobalamin-independent)
LALVFTIFTHHGFHLKSEVAGTIHKILKKVPLQNVWINPDCGLKTRGTTETTASLENVVAATRQVRKELAHEGR